jgi:translation initiation factor 4A
MSLSEQENIETSIEIMETQQEDPQKIIQSWDELNLNEDLLRGIYRYGFEQPTPIQKIAILPIINKRDVIAQAQSGTGKTGAFTVGTLQTIDVSLPTTQAIILAPTHELVKQIANVVSTLGNAMEGLTVKTLVGGSSVNDDIRDLRRVSPHVIVGSAGRVYDMIRRRCIQMDTVRLFVLDEADEMLSKGFKTQIYDIFQFFTQNIQVSIFSATLPPEVLSLTNKFMRDPVRLIMKPEELSLECISQYFVAMNDDHSKFETLKELFAMLEISQCIIYVGSIKRVDDLYQAMTKEGFPVCCIHSGMDKVERDASFQKFRSGSCRVLISSNITARGIDIQQVSTVIVFDIIRDVNTYLHAIGRSGRFGRKGLAINFVTKYDVEHMKRIEKHYGIEIQELPSDVKKIFN